MPSSAKKAMTRKERERERHRREVLEAAERVFVRKGYLNATMEEIANEAEFAVGTLYNFINNKEDLYFQVLDRHVQDYMAAIAEKVLKEPDAEKAIAALIRLRLNLYEKHKGFFLVFFETTARFQKDPATALTKEYDGLYDEYVKGLAGVFERGIRAGQFADIDPLYLALCLEGVVNAFTSYWSKVEPEEPVDVRVEKIANAFLGGVRRHDGEGCGNRPRASVARKPE